MLRKSLLSLSVAAAVALPGAAFAAATVYGVAHVSVDYHKASTLIGAPDVLGRKTDDTNVSSNSSRLGFKFEEDLGGGLKAIGQYEVQVGLDGEPGFITATRNSAVGLKGGFGQVLAGIWDTPLKDVRSKWDQFGDTAGDARMLLGTADGFAVAAVGANRFNMRAANAVKYSAPAFGGVSVEALWSGAAGASANAFGTDTVAAAVPAVMSIGGGWSGAGVTVNAAYETQKFTDTSATVSPDREGYRLSGTYAMGDFGVGALYEDFDSDDTTVGGNANATSDRSAWGLNGYWKFGNYKAALQYLNVDEWEACVGALCDTGAKNTTLGLFYNLSKAVDTYLLYTKTTNGANANFSVGGAGYGEPVTSTADGNHPTIASVGLRMKF